MSNVLSRIMPARAQATPVKVIADLDQLVPEPLGFKLGGKIYEIRVGTVRTLAQMSHKLEDILTLLQEKAAGQEVTDEDLYRAYHKYLSVLCPELTLSVIQGLNQNQLQRLLKEIIRYATGQSLGWGQTSEAAEKKKMILNSEIQE